MQASSVSRISEEHLFTSNDWQYTFDNSFARRFAENTLEEFDSLWELKAPAKCCTCCSSILFSSRSVDLSELATTGKDCQLCNLISGAAKPPNGETSNGRVIRSGSALTIDHNGHRRRILRLCSNLGSSEESDIEAQIGLPVLPAAGNHLRFTLIRDWLQRCDGFHSCNKHKAAKLPTRLLYVGDPKSLDYDSGFLKLVPTKKIGDQKYIALSHCWGDVKQGEVPPYCTTRENIEQREKGWKRTDLPLTFQHAVEVVRGLDVKYL
ncbi:hypothetical protein BKA61DRAFT_575255 [Leptodontidium sp. MPI-SDFR-AT-0119]|nr:hypothetical protein BKA61DRAFT_575255 [Leptodontidium sp. MPI-SDFR-AT-0119]